VTSAAEAGHTPGAGDRRSPRPRWLAKACCGRTAALQRGWSTEQRVLIQRARGVMQQADELKKP